MNSESSNIPISIKATRRKVLLRLLYVSIFSGGWFLFALLAWNVRERFISRADAWFPKETPQAVWEQTLKSKITSLHETPWLDERPHILMLGDSQIEMGNWYDLFNGYFAIRNGGLSQAKIKDVTRIADGISNLRPAVVLVSCGINDLGIGKTVDDTFANYLLLLAELNEETSNDQIIVVSIMPVARARLVNDTLDINSKVSLLNRKLQSHCIEQGIAFVDVTAAISKDGVLLDELTWDGLHLNSAGYMRLSERLRPKLMSTYNHSNGK